MVVIRKREHNTLLFSIDNAIVDPQAKTLRPRPGIRNLISMALSRKFTCIAVTQASQKEAEKTLRRLSCDNKKLVVVAGENDNFYKTTIERLNILPQLCAAFDGSDNGIRIARDAGISKIIDLRDNPRPDRLRAELLNLCGLTPDRP